MEVKKIQCVIYDCDGVMFDSLEANRRLYNYIATSLGRDELTHEELEFCHTHTVQESISFLFKDRPEDEIRALQFLKSSVDLKNFIPYLKMESNLVETLSFLKEKNVKTAVCTNRTTTMKHIMDIYNLWPYFDSVVTALDVKNPKPHPESVIKILRELDVQKENTVFVGDSEIDRLTASHSGVIFVSYKNPNLDCYAQIHNHLELITLFFP
ncbi:MAG: HAD family hydrolase [Deltaproteobacteria bacterium]|nr:HAD family hydrolase [Deltaproteobacteria bacterium]